MKNLSAITKYIITLLMAASTVLGAIAQQITNVTPNNVARSQNLNVLITGQGTSFVQGTSTNQVLQLMWKI